MWSTGAQRDEVAVMNTLTVNVHLLMVTCQASHSRHTCSLHHQVPFYNPTPQRYKVIMEGKSFPSDYFAVASQIKQRGFDPATALIEARRHCSSSIDCVCRY